MEFSNWRTLVVPAPPTISRSMDCEKAVEIEDKIGNSRHLALEFVAPQTILSNGPLRNTVF